MIQTRALTKSFEGFKALDGANLNAPKGSIYGLVGPNGAGKTTIIRHIAGVMRPDSGESLVDGLPIGMMIVGKRFDDATVLKLADAFESLHGGFAAPPKAPPKAAPTA